MVEAATTFIYALTEPDTNEVRYVGKSDDPKHRYDGHLADKRRTHKVSWIRSLTSRGVRPGLMILEEVTFAQWSERERYWIAYYIAQGARLTNTREGGEGGALTPEVLARRSAKIRGRTLTPEHRAKIGQGSKGHRVSEASRERWRQLGRNKSPETRAKISAAQTGRTMSPEQRAKISATLKGRGHPHTEETKERLRQLAYGNAAHLGHKHSPEAREKIRAANVRRFARARGEDNQQDGVVSGADSPS